LFSKSARKSPTGPPKEVATAGGSPPWGHKTNRGLDHRNETPTTLSGRSPHRYLGRERPSRQAAGIVKTAGRKEKADQVHMIQNKPEKKKIECVLERGKNDHANQQQGRVEGSMQASKMQGKPTLKTSGRLTQVSRIFPAFRDEEGTKVERNQHRHIPRPRMGHVDCSKKRGRYKLGGREALEGIGVAAKEGVRSVSRKKIKKREARYKREAPKDEAKA